MRTIVASDTASDQDRATVVVAFARAQQRMMMRNLIVLAANDQEIEPSEEMICPIVNALESAFDLMISADGKLGLQLRMDTAITAEYVMLRAVQGYACGIRHDDFIEDTNPDPHPEAPCTPKKQRR